MTQIADEVDELWLSIGAQMLVADLADGCTVYRTGGGAPAIVMPAPGGRIPRTRGKVSDVIMEELLDHGLVYLLSETPPQPCGLTPMGEAYHERFLKNRATDRSVEAQLLEAELINSTPERVHEWLRSRAEAPSGASNCGDEELEVTLLGLNSGLIDLGLARYGFSGAVVRSLFLGDRHRNEDLPIPGGSGMLVPGMEHTLRLAALSNRALRKHLGMCNRMPQVLFGPGSLGSMEADIERIREFVASADLDEVIALFQNPTIDDELLIRLYAKGSPFDSLGEERWQHLIMASVGNPRLRAEYAGPMDGWAEYSHASVFDAAWGLAQMVPTTKCWANILVPLLEETSPEAFSIKDKMAAIQRWQVAPGGEADATDSATSENGYLDAFASVRLVLVRLLSESEVQGLKNHEDIAMRCGFYRYGKPTQTDLEEAHAREPEFLLSYALGNDAVWKRDQTRDALCELCRAVKSKPDLWFPNAFQSREQQLQAEHPDWFRQDGTAPAEDGALREAVLDSVKAVHIRQGEMQNQLAALRHRVTLVLWMMVLVLVLMLLRRL